MTLFFQKDPVRQNAGATILHFRRNAPVVRVDAIYKEWMRSAVDGRYAPVEGGCDL